MDTRLVHYVNRLKKYDSSQIHKDQYMWTLSGYVPSFASCAPTVFKVTLLKASKLHGQTCYVHFTEHTAGGRFESAAFTAATGSTVVLGVLDREKYVNWNKTGDVRIT